MVKIDIPQDAQERVDRLRAAQKCLGCEQPLELDDNGKEIQTRGQCTSCIQATYRAVQRGRTTFDQLMKKGELLPKKEGGRPTSNPYVNKLYGRETA